MMFNRSILAAAWFAVTTTASVVLLSSLASNSGLPIDGSANFIQTGAPLQSIVYASAMFSGARAHAAPLHYDTALMNKWGLHRPACTPGLDFLVAKHGHVGPVVLWHGGRAQRGGRRTPGPGTGMQPSCPRTQPGALATVAGLNLVAWSVRSATSGRPASPRAPASPLIQRFIVPDVRAALQGVLEGEKGRLA